MGEAEQSGLVRNAIVLGLVVAVATIIFVVFGTMIGKVTDASSKAGDQVDTYLKADSDSSLPGYNVTVPEGENTFSIFPDIPVKSKCKNW